ncbi:Retrovirus-related Pol polyprotein from transposon TNT 1-94, partial [Linum grandiflorum]
IFRYLRGTSKLSLCYGGGKPILESYTDEDRAGDLESRKSTSGYVFTFSGGAISWQSKLQKCVALSTTETEYITDVEAGKEFLWLKRFLQELGLEQSEYVVFCDSQSVIDLSRNTMYHSRTKYIDVRYHWLRDVIEEKMMKLKKVHTDKNCADVLTKVVPGSKVELCSKLAGMRFK